MLLIHTEKKEREIQELEKIPTLDFAQMVLFRAAELIEEKGHVVGGGTGSDGSVCAVIAINAAEKLIEPGSLCMYSSARHRLHQYLGLTSGKSIVDWNDQLLHRVFPRYAKKRVLKALRGAAK